MRQILSHACAVQASGAVISFVPRYCTVHTVLGAGSRYGPTYFRSNTSLHNAKQNGGWAVGSGLGGLAGLVGQYQKVKVGQLAASSLVT